MAVAIGIELPTRDFAMVQEQMRRLHKEFGKDAADEVKFAGWAISRALGAATNVSPKRRPVKVMTVKMGTIKAKRYSKSGKTEFGVDSYKGKKGRHTFSVYAYSLPEAKADKRVRIGRSGLAKRMWRVAQSKLGSSAGAGGSVSGYTARTAANNMAVEKNLKGLDPQVKITNKLDYATKAFKTGGDQTVSNVCERAHKIMAHTLDAKIAKKLGVKLWK